MKRYAHKTTIIFCLALLVCFESESQSTLDDVESSEDANKIEALPSTINGEEILLDYEIERTRNFNKGYKSLDNRTESNLSTITAAVQLNIPESFESYYIQFKQEGFSNKGLELLQNAEQKTENKAELYTDFIACSHILRKPLLFDEYTLKLRNSGFISTEVLEYNKNVLRSVEPTNSFIVTNGWEDTYPLLSILTQEKRTQVEVINVEWIINQEYRALLSSRLGIANGAFQNDPYDWIYKASQSTAAKVYFTPTLPGSVLVKAQDSLTPVGLVFSTKPLSASEQKQSCLASWKKFSKNELISSSALSKNYIILLNVLESLLAKDKTEQETYQQIKDYKKELIKNHPELN